ncbi:MAG: glycosyltransferase [Candidatus Heimdallarchaeaceae archaeon]
MGLIENFLILIIEVLSAFYSIFIYYYIGSSANYQIIKDEKNKFLSQDPLPFVSIVVPMYREPFRVVSKTIEGALNVDYPNDRFEVIVADDSPAEESKELESFCNSHNVKYVRRNNRKGFKAGALNNVLSSLSSDFLALLDSDHIPTKNFLRTCLSGFTDDKVIFVQGKPMFVNQDNYIQRSSAFIHSQFFHIMQKSRAMRDGVIFAGTTGVFRIDLLKQFGGFLEDTLAEDTDTSFVLIAEGYKTRYIHEICSYGLVPWTPISMLNQIWRWSHGITQILVKRSCRVLKGKGSFINKVDMISTTLTPLIGITMWFANFFILVLNFFVQIPFVRPTLTDFSIPLLLLAPILIAFANLVMGVVAWIREEREDKMIRLRGFWGFLWTLIAFYFLMLTAQSFLIWSVFSALFGVKKEFKRTIKKKPKSVGKMSEKIKYSLWSFGLFLLAFPFYYAIYKSILTSNPLLGWFVMSAISLSIPILITITYFKELDFLKNIAASKTAADVVKEYGD